MATDFAKLQDRANDAIMRALCNSTGTLNGVSVAGIVSAGFDDVTFAGPGKAGSSPVFTLPAASVPANPEGLPLVILNGPAQGNYTVGYPEPDGTGLVNLHLLLQTP